MEASEKEQTRLRAEAEAAREAARQAAHELGGQLGELTAKHDDAVAGQNKAHLELEQAKLELSRKTIMHERELIKVNGELERASAAANRKAASSSADSDRSVRMLTEHKQQVASARIELEAALQESLDVTKAKTKLETENSDLLAQLAGLRADSADNSGEVDTLRRERTSFAEQLAAARQELAAAKRQLAATDGPASEAELTSKIDHLRSELAAQSSAHAAEMDEVIAITKGLRTDLETSERLASTLRADKRDADRKAATAAGGGSGGDLAAKLAATEAKHSDAIDTIIALQDERDALQTTAAGGIASKRSSLGGDGDGDDSAYLAEKDRADQAEETANALQAELDILKLNRSAPAVTADAEKAHTDKRYDEAIDTIIALQDTVTHAEERIQELEAAAATGTSEASTVWVAAAEASASLAAKQNARITVLESELAESRLDVSAATVNHTAADHELAELKVSAAASVAKVAALQAELAAVKKQAFANNDALDTIIALQDAASTDGERIKELESELAAANAAAGERSTAEVSSELIATIKLLQSQGKEHRSKYSEVVKQLAESDGNAANVAAVNEENAKLKQQNADCVQQIVALQAEVDEAVEEAEQAVEDAGSGGGGGGVGEHTEEEVSALKEQVEDALETITVVMDERDVAEARIAELEAEVIEALGDPPASPSALNLSGGAQLQMDAHKSEAKILKLKLEKAEAAASDAEHALAAKSQELADAVDAVASIMADKDASESKAVALQAMVDALHSGGGSGGNDDSAAAAAAATAEAIAKKRAAEAAALEQANAARVVRKERRRKSAELDLQAAQAMAAAAKAEQESADALAEARAMAAEAKAEQDASEAAKAAEAADYVASPSASIAPPVKRREKKMSLDANGEPVSELQKTFQRRSVRGRPTNAIFNSENPFSKKTATPAEPAPPVDMTGMHASERASLFEKTYSAGAATPAKATAAAAGGTGAGTSSPFGRKKGGASLKFGSNTKKCPVCSKSVYLAEEVKAEGKSYHKSCFRCTTCTKIVKTTTFASYQGSVYCKNCFMKNFREKGNYDEGFGHTQHKSKWLQGSNEDDAEC